jgi:diguanylate cyclase (GGDEF)-like protein
MKDKKIGFKREFSLFYLMLGGMVFAHLFYIFFFYTVGSLFMSAFNMFSVVFYIILFIFFVIKENTKILNYLVIEIIIHAFIATLVIGMNNGFEFFLICTAFASHHLVRITHTSKVTAYIINISVFFILLGLKFLPSSTVLSFIKVFPVQSYLSAIYVFNLVMAFIMIFLVLLVFLREIRSDEERLKILNSKLSELASHDSLTQLLNRRAMKARLEAALDFKKKNNVGFVTAIADIDDFKKINDKYGHDCGDKVLKKVVQVIKENVRESDYISRWGGDEILILFNRSTIEGASVCIERIHKEIANSIFLHNNEIINLTITIGVCPSEDYSYYQDIILEADRRLYDGKHKGKNCIIYEAPLAPIPDI